MTFMRSVYASPLVIALAAFTPACDGGAGQHEAPPNFDQHLAALGTAVLDCKGAIAPDDFDVNDGVLETTLEACPLNVNALEEIRLLLGIQRVAESGAKPRFAEAFTAWRARYSGDACPPRWTALEAIDKPTPEGALASMAGTTPQESKTRWKITPPADCNGSVSCAVDRAVECSSWFGTTFHVSVNAERGEVITDPSWWKDNTPYYPNPFVLPYAHDMANWGLPPGDIWGAINRAGETCSKYTPDMTYIVWNRTLVPVDCGDGWYCATRCQ
jgi:hypothetical protein